MRNFGGIWSIIFYPPVVLVWSTMILLATGLFFSFFVGDTVLISGIKHEKKIEEKTTEEIKTEENEIKVLTNKIEKISEDIEEIKNTIHGK